MISIEIKQALNNPMSSHQREISRRTYLAYHVYVTHFILCETERKDIEELYRGLIRHAKAFCVNFPIFLGQIIDDTLDPVLRKALFYGEDNRAEMLDLLERHKSSFEGVIRYIAYGDQKIEDSIPTSIKQNAEEKADEYVRTLLTYSYKFSN